MQSVEVVYIDSQQQLFYRQLQVKPTSTVAEVLQQSGLYEQHPECQAFKIGIFAKPVALEQIVQPGDRIEVYRPLTLNPMDKRRLRAKQAR